MSGLEALPHVIRANGVSYVIDRVIGNGSFGVVLQARSEATGDVVAIKRVLQDKRYKVFLKNKKCLYLNSIFRTGNYK